MSGYTVIPNQIGRDRTIPPFARLLYGSILAKSRTSPCWASNRTLAAEYGVDERTVQLAIAKLRDAGYITVQLIGGGNTQRLITPRITIEDCNKGERKIVEDEETFASSMKVFSHTHEKTSTPIKEVIENTKHPNDVDEYFVPPTIAAVEKYVMDRGGKIDFRRFYEYYESAGWRVGRSAMRDWKAMVRKWERSERVMAAAKEKDYSYSGGESL